MNPFEFLPAIVEEHHKELMREAEQYRMLTNAFEADRPSGRELNKFLAVVGKKFVALGNSLEARFGNQSDAQVGFTRQRKSEECA